jgi:RHS repeat-associated protein
MTTFQRSLACILGALALAGCGDDAVTGKGKTPTETDCGDGADNDKDGQSDCNDLDCRLAGGSCEFAPALDRTIATTLTEAASFLYTGPDPVQKGVDTDKLDSRRIAMVNGRVVDDAGEPLAGVRVSVSERSEYGYTLTRSDGVFNLAVNGGARLVLKYELDGYVPAERISQPGWQRYGELPEVGLIRESENSTQLESRAGSLQVALAGRTEDAFGTRQLVVMMQAGTRASAELTDGSEEDLSTLTLRVTEYPFEAMGDNEAWQPTARFAPGTLPLSGGIHYGMELRVDEAERMEARWVSFSTPVSIYVENFLGLPVGAPVPLGYYDRKVSQWQPAEGGRVIRILAVEGESAAIDTNGDGEADDADTLDDLGVTGDELAELGKRYEPGTELWRAMVSHFSPWDVLFPVSPRPGALAPNAAGLFDRAVETFARRGAAVIEPLALSQSVPVVGTPYTLHYQSDRTADYKKAFQVEVPLVPGTVPEGLQSVRFQVRIAGKRLERFLDPEPDLTVALEWDGEDSFGRRVQGPQTAEITIGYVFDGLVSIGNTFGASGVAAAVDTSDLGIPILGAVISETFETQLGVWDARGYDLGGFSFDVQHAYDAVHRRVFFGHGDERRGENVGLVVKDLGLSADLGTPDGVALAPDGSLVVTDDAVEPGRILRITPDGETTIVAGPGADGPAGNILLGQPQGVAVTADGSIIVADFADDTVGRISPDGSFEVIVDSLDLFNVDGIALGPSEDLFIVEEARVFRFAAGRLSVFAGGGTSRAEGVAATEAELVVPSGVVVASDGSVFISERGDVEGLTGHRVRKVSPDGTIRTVAGTDQAGFSGDGGRAVEAALDNPRGLALGADGSLYIADQENNRVRRVTPDGIIQSVVGGGDSGETEGQLADAVVLAAPDGITIGRDGKLFVANGTTVFRVAPGLPELANHDDFVPTVDGRTLHRFDHRGKHLETVDAMTGVTELTFTYDANGRLASLRDKNGLVTEIERARDGSPRAIIAPFGQRTELEVDDAGNITRVVDVLERAFSFEYAESTALIEKFIDRKGGEHSFVFDEEGLLRRIDDPTGYFQALTPTKADDGFSVSVETPEGRIFDYTTTTTAGNLARSVVYPDTTSLSYDDERVIHTDTQPDGTVVRTDFEKDDFFGPQSLFPETITMTTPSGRQLVTRGDRQKFLSDDDNALSVNIWSETVNVNGRVFQTNYFREVQALDYVLPSGRTVSTFFDELGRATDIVVPGMGLVHKEYDDQGRVIEVAKISDDEDDVRLETLEYGNDGMLAAITDPEGNVTSYDRDAAGRITALLYADGSRTSLAYDDNDNLTQLTPPGRDAHTFEYEALTDLLSASVAPAVDQESPSDLACGESRYEYSENLDLVRTRRADGRDVVRAYDENGRLTTIDLADATVTVSYDSAGKLSSVNRSDSVRVGFTFDGPLWTSSTWTGAVEGSVKADYDDDFRLAMLTVNDAHTVRFSYDDDDLVIGASASGGSFTIERDSETGFVRGTTLGEVTTSQSYNGLGEVRTLRANFDGTTDAFRQDIERDALGRVTRLTETFGGSEKELTYTYDELGRLIEAARDGEVTTYTYDENGNRLSVERPGEDVVLAEYDAQDRILSHGEQSYEQSPDGDLFRRTNGEQAVELSYDEIGNLMTAALSDSVGSTDIEYMVDGLNRRVARRRNGSFSRAWFYRDGLRPVGEVTSEGVFSHFVYTSERGAPDVIFRAGVPHRVIKDHLGSVRAVVNAVTDTVEQLLEYDEFGRVLVDTNPGFQPFGFAGGLFDPDTKLVRFGARDYDPGMGRWMAKDPAHFDGDGTNLYVYTLNDPVNYVDPEGRFIAPILCMYYMWRFSEVMEECRKKVEEECAGDNFLTPECLNGSGGWYTTKQFKCILERDPGAAAHLGQYCAAFAAGAAAMGLRPK